MVRVSIAAALLVLAPALGQAQSLGAAATQAARERVKQPGAATKVYTDADLRAGTDAETSPAASDAEDPAPAPNATPAPDAVRAELDREAEARRAREKAWKSRARALRARLERAERDYGLACGPGGLQLAGG